MFKNKTLMITGGTGSFGNAVLKRFLDSELDEIRIFSRDEKKQDEMRHRYSSSKIKYYIGDVRNSESVNNAMRGIDFVFHAAALKQVPSCEFFPLEAVKTNILGTENVLNSALMNNVKKVIVLSTDKAVYPINAMGMTKALSEKIMVAKSRNINQSSTVFCGTRYGNVMASRGSVIPLFVNQIKQGQNITITDPKMTRFMMTLDDAVDLVLFAFKNGVQGDIFVQKSPACTLDILAKALLKMYNSTNSIKIIGTRHGEKVFETLVNREEMIKAENLNKYYRIPADIRNLNYGKYFSDGNLDVSAIEDYTSHNTTRLDIKETIELLLKLDSINRDFTNKNNK